MPTGARLLLIPLALLGAGCGDDALELTAGEGGGQTGFAVLLADDPTDGTGTASGSTAPEAIVASLAGAVRVGIRNEDGVLVDLGLAQDVFLPLQTVADTVIVSAQRPPADTYVAVQLRFENADVTVEEGSEIGGVALDEDAFLGIGSGGIVTLELSTQPFVVSSESTADVIVDLNAETWITGANIDDAIVSETDMRDNVTVDIL